MSMTVTKTITVGEGLNAQVVTVRELTVGEIRAWMKRAAEGGGDVVDDTLLQEVSLPDLFSMTDLKADQVEGMTPSQLRQVVNGCREVNPDFFGLRDRIESAGRQILERLSEDLNETSAH